MSKSILRNAVVGATGPWEFGSSTNSLQSYLKGGTIIGCLLIY